MGFNVASVKSYVSSALTTTLFGSGVGEREVGKLTSIIMNKMLFAQGWQFSVEVDWWTLSRDDGSPCKYQKSYAYEWGSDAQ